jgi:CheY-like chemotaxis protein
MQKIRILVVEDETIVSLDIQNRLRMLGYEVVGAAVSGEEAIEKAGLHRPDLVLMDIMLDGNMDGIAAAERIRGRLHIPVIYLTAHADTYTLHRAKVTEPFGYILKPFEERELHGHIEIALYKHRM